MAVVGRILQIMGWLWIAAGLFGPRFGLDGFNVLPGVLLLFISRVFRARARREMPPGPGESQPEPQSVTTERQRSERQQSTPPTPSPAPTYTPPEPEPEPEMEPKRPVQERNDLLERIALAGREAAEEPSSGESEEVDPSLVEDDRTPMSSAEMIAQARRRWDRT